MFYVKSVHNSMAQVQLVRFLLACAHTIAIATAAAAAAVATT